MTFNFDNRSAADFTSLHTQFALFWTLYESDNNVCCDSFIDRTLGFRCRL